MATLLARLQDRFAVLAGGGGQARWDTLRSALRWSWDLLDDDERSALAQCAVFPEPFDAARR